MCVVHCVGKSHGCNPAHKICVAAEILRKGSRTIDDLMYCVNNWPPCGECNKRPQNEQQMQDLINSLRQAKFKLVQLDSPLFKIPFVDRLAPSELMPSTSGGASSSELRSLEDRAPDPGGHCICCGSTYNMGAIQEESPWMSAAHLKLMSWKPKELGGGDIDLSYECDVCKASRVV